MLHGNLIFAQHIPDVPTDRRKESPGTGTDFFQLRNLVYYMI